MSKKDPRLARAGVSGYNKPKRTPNHPKKSHVVVAKVGDKTKLIRFGQQGVRGAGKNPKSKKDKARRKSYYARHNAQDAKPSKLSARYWSHKVKSAAKRNRMARNKARGQVVSDEQIANNWDKIFNKNKTQEQK